jgi:hypothetical protein
MSTPPPANSPDSHQSESSIIPNHPLADVIGKFEGEIWEATLDEIQRLRRLDRKRWEKAANINRDVG